jgi:hypothetical protein
MCYLLFAKKLKKTAKNKTLTDIFSEKIKYNTDGACYLTDKGNYLRTLENDEYLNLLPKAVNKANWLISHLRFATNGAKTLNNVHLFERDGFYFAHNGIISEYTGKSAKDGEKSDSLLYFNNLIDSIKNLDDKHITKRIKKSNFFDGGRAMLILPNGKMFLYGDFKAYNLDGWLIISSSSLYFSQKEKTLDFGAVKLKKGNNFYGDLDGIYSIDLRDKKLSFVKNGVLPEKKTIGFNYTPESYNNYSYMSKNGRLFNSYDY